MAKRTRDFHAEVAEFSLVPAVRTTNNATVAGSAIDTQGAGELAIEANVGVFGDATVSGAKLEFYLQHSDTTATSDFTAVAASQLALPTATTQTGSSTVTGVPTAGFFGVVSTTANDETILRAGYMGNKRYVRAVVAAEKNQTNGTPYSVSARKTMLKSPAV